MIEQVDAAEMSPGEFSERVRRCVEVYDAKTVVIDSLNGYQAAMPEERALILHMHELLQYLNRQGASTFLTVAQHGLVGDMKAPVDVTYLADTVILLRYFEAIGPGAARDLDHQEAHRRAREHDPRICDRSARDDARRAADQFPRRAARRTDLDERRRDRGGLAGLIPHLSERALILAPQGRDAEIAASMLAEAGIVAFACQSVEQMVAEMVAGAGFGLITEEALHTVDLHAMSRWLNDQPEWSDFPFILLTLRGGGLERNPSAARFLDTLGNVTFLERPFHPTTLVSLARSARRARRRQYDARARLEELHTLATDLERRVDERTAEREDALRQLHEAQKLETLGQLTGGVAHDFNNLLTPIIGTLDLLQHQLGGTDARVDRWLANALQSGERAKTLVQRLLGFARRQELRSGPIDLVQLIQGMRDLIASSVGPPSSCVSAMRPTCRTRSPIQASSNSRSLICASTRATRCPAGGD